MFRTLALFCVLAFCCYSQPIIVQPSAIAGIEIVSPQAPDFAAAVAQITGADPPRNLLAWLPYGVIVRNNSSQPLAGLCVLWSAAYDARALRQLGNICSQWFNGPAHQIKPGHAVLAIPAAILQQARDVRPFSDGNRLVNLPNYQRAQRLEVSVDSVVFASGQFAGSDTVGEYERFQAELEIPPTVAARLLEMKASGTISNLVTWLQSLDDESRRSTVDDFSSRQYGSMAREMLRVYASKGEAALYSMAADLLHGPLVPLHR